MMGVLIAINTRTGKNKVKASAFSKAFYGQGTSSHKGKYRYWRRGFLDDIPYVKLIRGVIIVRKEDSDKVLDFLRQYPQIEISVREVIPSTGDLDVLLRRSSKK